METIGKQERGAIISNCGTYRYALWRYWDRSLPKALFLMLNPSIADAELDDPTLRRCMGFARTWGYGGLFIGNRFAFRCTQPGLLLKAEDPIGPLNGTYLSQMAERSEIIICAWGNAPIIKRLGQPFPDSITGPLHCIELSKDGTPKHPLYLKSNLKPIPYKA